MGTDLYLLLRNRKTTSSSTLTILTLLALVVSCKSIIDRQADVRPRILRDVPAQNLAYRLQADVSPPSEVKSDDADKFAAVQNDFNTPKRKDDALIRTVVSPDGRRVLALYGTTDEPSSAFRIDLYNSDGMFLRNIIPPSISCVFPETVSWSPDGSLINFIAHRREMPSPVVNVTVAIEDDLVDPLRLQSLRYLRLLLLSIRNRFTFVTAMGTT